MARRYAHLITISADAEHGHEAEQKAHHAPQRLVPAAAPAVAERAVARH
jgi:hypothetical protein